MINKEIEQVIMDDGHPLMIKSEDVATVRMENTLLHATMVLSTVGYSSIPVLDNDHKLRGVVTIPMIIEGIKDQVAYNWDLLADKRIEDVVSTDFSCAKQGLGLEDILHQLINHNYVCIVDDEGVFLGIITRKSILKRINHLVHELDNIFDLKKVSCPS